MEGFLHDLTQPEVQRDFVLCIILLVWGLYSYFGRKLRKKMTVAQLKEKIKDLPDDYNIQEKQCGFFSDMRYEFEVVNNKIIVHKFYEYNPPWKNN